MMKLILSLTLLWTICSSVGALQCQSCSDSQCLNVATVTCSSETMCVTASSKAIIIPSDTKEAFLKACAPSSLCPSTGSRTFQSNSGLSNTVTFAECCDTDNCNAGTLPVPSRNTTKNSLSCHFCATPSVCDVHFNCEGFEDRCYRATVLLGGSTSTVGGCVSTNLAEAISSLQTFPQLLTVGNISSFSSCSGSLCLDLTAPPATTASSNITSQVSSGSTSTTAASGTSGGSTAASGISGGSTAASGGSGSGGSGASTAAPGGSGSGSGGSGASTIASGGSGSGSGGSGASTAAPGGSGASTTVCSGSSSQSIDGSFIRLGLINLLFGLFTLILC